jgi:hypothetical protein
MSRLGRRFTYFQAKVEEEAMEGMGMTEGMTPDQVAEAQRTFEVMKKAAEEELWRMACLMARKPDAQLLGRTEFEVRDHLHRIGAKAIETAVNGRKKGGTKGAASSAGNAGRMPALSGGGKRRS